MSENGQRAMKVILQMKRLYEEMSLLLRTADKCMEKSGWKSLSNYAMSWSYHIEWPTWWLPQDIYRFYKKDDAKHVLAFVSAALFDRGSDDKLSEPLLCAGWFDYGAEFEGVFDTGSPNLVRWAHWHVSQEVREDDGNIRKARTEMTADDKFQSAWTMGLPLTEISTTDELLKRVVDPIVQGIASARSPKD